MIELFRNTEAIIFDLDGTLYNKKKFVRRLLFRNIFDIFIIKNERKTRKIIKTKSFDTSEEYYCCFFEIFSNQFKNKKFTIYFLRKWYFNKYLPEFVKILKKHYQLRYGVNEIFELLYKKNIKLSVLSNYPFVVEKMQALGIESDKYEIQCFSSENFGALKPNVRPFLELAKILDVESKNILVVGDKIETDGIGAINSNMKFLQIVDNKKYITNQAITWEMFVDGVLKFCRIGIVGNTS